jgi:hypothetical protein
MPHLIANKPSNQSMKPNGPFAKYVHGACHDTLPWIISFSLGRFTVRDHLASGSSQADLDIAAAPFLIFGILYGLTGLLPLVIPIVTRYFDHDKTLLFGFMLGSGVALALIGVGLMKRWRFTLLPPLPLCILGLLQFPIGTILFGWALYALWTCRTLFYPFDRPATQKA